MTIQAHAPLDELPRGERVLVSRALAPDLASRISAGRELVEAPVVHGVTIWSAAGVPADRAVVTQPNWYGCIEDADLIAAIECPTVTATEPGGDPTRASYLSRRLAVMSRTRLAHGPPQGSVFVVLLPSEPARILPAEPPPGVEVTVLADRPELPGGVRFAVAAGAAEAELKGYAAALEAAIRDRS